MHSQMANNPSMAEVNLDYPKNNVKDTKRSSETKKHPVIISPSNTT